MSYSVKIAEPHLGREITFTAPTADAALYMARSWSPMTGPLGTTYPGVVPAGHIVTGVVPYDSAGQPNA